jgi:hypothetical protein
MVDKDYFEEPSDKYIEPTCMVDKDYFNRVEMHESILECFSPEDYRNNLDNCLQFLKQYYNFFSDCKINLKTLKILFLYKFLNAIHNIHPKKDKIIIEPIISNTDYSLLKDMINKMITDIKKVIDYDRISYYNTKDSIVCAHYISHIQLFLLFQNFLNYIITIIDTNFITSDEKQDIKIDSTDLKIFNEKLLQLLNIYLDVLSL